eukprot:gb/GFBE01030341.1/.p1 GENE.gb/GFBE01030341.1/~~gb/GFBE01030341.1/.p1  ORF type:complete len:727 (+),score=116.74 gb/GFBE01030341.1/:1-2181(+)
MSNSDANVTELLERIHKLEKLVNLQMLQHADFAEESGIAMDTSWVLSSTTLAFLMQVGFALLEAGCVREQNVIATWVKNIMDFVISVSVGGLGCYHLAYPGSEIHVLEDGGRVEHLKLRQSFFAHVIFQAAAATIVSGAVAERANVGAYMLLSVFMASVIYPVCARWTWGGGFLSELDPPFHDFAGSGVVHLVGGAVALVACVIIGPRAGRFDPVRGTEFVPHNVPSVITGTMLLWFGWYGFNAGSQGALKTREDASVVASAFMTTTLAACFSAITTTFISIFCSRLHSIDILSVCQAIISGLVAITAGCDVIPPGSSCMVGIGAAFVYWAADALCIKCAIDDAVSAFAVHGACGAWGLLCVGIWHRETGLAFANGYDQLGSQACGTLILFLYPATVSGIILTAFRCSGILRVAAETEAKGLDDSLGQRAYVTRSKAMAETRYAAETLSSFGITPEQVLESLETLRDYIYRPFSPQAADNKLNGEVEDILEHMEYAKIQNYQYFAFTSHHKKDGGEAARVFVDAIRRQLGSTNRAERRHVLAQFPPERLVFLDSNNLKDLSELLDHAKMSQNFVLLLTRNVFTRPWVLAEICVAVKAGVNVVVVHVETPDKDDPRSFRPAVDFETPIRAWQEYIKLNSGSGSVSPHRFADKTASFKKRKNARQAIFDYERGSGENSMSASSFGDSDVLSPTFSPTLEISEGLTWDVPDNEILRQSSKTSAIGRDLN